MTSNLRRSAAFALVASLSLGAPVLGRAMAAPFALVAAGAFAVTDGPVFDLFALPRDRQEGRLRGLIGFSLAATGLALLTPTFGLPATVFAATVLLVGFGDLAKQLAETYRNSEFAGTAGFAVGGFVAALAGEVAVRALTEGVDPGSLPESAFLAASGALLAALLRSVFVGRDDPLVMLSVALLLWLFADLAVQVTWARIAVALGVTLLFGYLSWAMGAASIPGMVTGVFLGLLTIVLGGFGWFAVLLAFFGVGALSTKYRYDEKADRGVAEERGGARGSGNVLGNSAPALLAVLLFAASPRLPVAGEVFVFAFAGSMATALSDTLSSEIGGLYDNPRLVTTLETVPPGTDGGVTWQGELAGVAGAMLIAGTAALLFGVDATGAAVIVAAGVVGMTADSLLGATVEGGVLGNQAVNFLATAVGAVAGGALAVAFGLVGV